MRRLSPGTIGYLILSVIFIVNVLHAQTSPHGPLKNQCTDCHSTESWNDLVTPMKFNHTSTGFALNGMHSNIPCIQCHTTKRFSGTPTECFSCHQNDFNQALTPNHQLGKFSHDCLDCHTYSGWRPSIFQHSKTNFQLSGAHISVDCASCHTNNRFAGLSTDCFSCHQKEYSETTTPNHLTAQFSRDCLTCHTMNGWTPSTFNHSKTNFALVGAHISVECSSCHTNGKFRGTTVDCYGCHQTDYVQTVSPNHSTAQFSHECITCHTNVAWKPSTFDHSKTNFLLVGAHQSAECSSCHTNGQFKGLPTECYLCHQTQYASVVTPNHVNAQLSHDCLECHSNIIWKPSTFDHNKTNYQLLGAHQIAECSSCHTNGQFKGLPTECYPCHQVQFTNVFFPNHTTGQFSHVCLECHTVTAWKPTTFDHSKTNFQLLGAHQTAECSSCHTNGQFKGIPTECFPCHQVQFTNVVTPNHVTGQLSHDCTECHSLIAWKPSTFDHNKTNFQLTGAHITQECSSCHKNGQFKGTASDCFTCHQQDYTSTVTPNHALAQFSQDCLSCHSTFAWKPSTFNHSTTNFVLTGAHTSIECASCHKNGQFKGTASDCYSCHQQEYAATVTPNHALAQFSHDCTTCHNSVAWKPSTFNHSTTSFPLTGAHITTDCLFCHKNGQFKGTASDCYSCHQTDFTGVTDPNHVSGNFDHICSTCHTTSAWEPATFDHNKTNFKLTGAHLSADCQSCHVGGKFAGTSTDCFVCHQQDYNSSASPAHATAHYPTTCITCHTTTAWKPSTFDHTPFFPIGTGSKHRPGRWATCADCHTNSSNFKIFSCITCHEHNKTEMDDKHKGRTGYVYDSNACYNCHPRGESD